MYIAMKEATVCSHTVAAMNTGITLEMLAAAYTLPLSHRQATACARALETMEI